MHVTALCFIYKVAINTWGALPNDLLFCYGGGVCDGGGGGGGDMCFWGWWLGLWLGL